MTSISAKIRIGSLALLLGTYVFAAPVSAYVYAQDAGTQTGASGQTGPQQPLLQGPTGASAHLYTYNPTTGKWESQYYTWDPVTQKRIPKYDVNYVYNPSNGMWEQTNWVYSPAAGAYKASVTKLPYNPYQQAVAPTNSIGNTGTGSSNQITNANDNPASITNTGNGSTNSIDDPQGPTSINNTGAGSNNEANLGAINNTGPKSQNVIAYDEYGNVIYDVEVEVDVDNKVNSIAKTGDAGIFQNTSAGSALTGNATTTSNTLNMIQSTVGLMGAVPNVFTANIQGDYVGDIVINPKLLTSKQSPVATDNLKVNVSTDADITNDINLLSVTGDATVAKNTLGGDAVSGDATAVANVINMINSAITSGDSFIGILNVNGDFEGDVLVADDVIDQLIAANVPTSQVCLCGMQSEMIANIDTNQTINNNIEASAKSGKATVSNNTAAGDAKSGDANTNVTVFNLTGQRVVADSAILVFVNVLGKWVGFITDAPKGATSALLGGGVDNAPYAYNGSAEYSIDSDFTINNNIKVGAETGDATVDMNTEAGDAITGDAYSAANVANITDSSLSLDSWFGLLFINVFGNWHGSFGTDTAYGGRTTQPGMGGDSIAYPPKPRSSSSNTENGQPISDIVAYRVTTTGSGESVAHVASAKKISPEEVASALDASTGETAKNDDSKSTSSSKTNYVPVLAVAGISSCALAICYQVIASIRKRAI